MKLIGKRKRFYRIFLLIAGIAFSSFQCTKQSQRLNPGDTAPLFIAGMPGDDSFALEKYKGKILLLHFWADWCADCRAEFPKLQKAYQELGKRNFEIIAVNVGQSEDHVRSFIEKYDLTFPMLLDKETTIAGMYHIKGLPTNYFIKPDLTIYKIVIGWVNEDQIRQILNSLSREE